LIPGYTKTISDSAAYLNVPLHSYRYSQPQQVVYLLPCLTCKGLYGFRHKTGKVLKQRRLVLL
jgi:hypothetical protein